VKILIVGAGFSGATLARCLAETGHVVTVYDARPHVAGNAHDYVDSNGIRVHKYGPHIYHTSNEQVHEFLSRFTEWIPYEHKVKALWRDRLVPFPYSAATENIVHAYTRAHDEEVDVIEEFYGRYTRKMWGIEKDRLDPSILARVPIRKNFEARYFPGDKFQFLPRDGYDALILNMLDHENIKVECNRFVSSTDIKHFLSPEDPDFDHVFPSQPIDEFYDYRFGELPYRSIKFHTSTVPAPQMFGVPVVNFTHEGPYTRVTEWKQFPGHGSNDSVTTVTVEEPCDYRDNNMERYYPVKDLEGVNRAKYEQYKAIETPGVTFIGRTGQYVYIDMHQAVNSSLQLAKKFDK
jgi:UDP-galactopyranose mutase